MLLNVNSTLNATITATLLTTAHCYIADQSDLSAAETSMQVYCTQYSCVVFGARNLYKKLWQTCNGASILCKSICARFLYKFLDCMSPALLQVRLIHKNIFWKMMWLYFYCSQMPFLSINQQCQSTVRQVSTLYIADWSSVTSTIRPQYAMHVMQVGLVV